MWGTCSICRRATEGNSMSQLHSATAIAIYNKMTERNFMFDYKGYQIYEEERDGRTIYSFETASGLATIESRSFTALVEAINQLPEPEGGLNELVN